MTQLIEIIAPFLPAKTRIINAILSTMPDSTKQIEFGRLIAKHLPNHHLHLNPKAKK